MDIRENKEYQKLFEKWNRLTNIITYNEATPENFRECAKLSKELAEMMEGKEQCFANCAKYRNRQCDPRHGDDCLECTVFERME